MVVNPGESIQDVIDALLPGGGIVELAAGIHTIDAPIKTISNLILIGQGMELTKIYGSGTFNIINIVNDSNVAIKKLFVDTPGSTENKDGIAIVNSSDISINHVKVSHCWSGIQTNRNEFSLYVNNLSVEDCILTYNTCGMGNVNLRNSKILRTEASHNSGWDGIEFNSGCDNNLVEYCVVHHSHMNGFFTYNGCDNNIWRNNIVYSNGASGLRAHNTGDNQSFINNLVYDNNYYGISIGGTPSDEYTFLVESNTFYSNGWSGIRNGVAFTVTAKNNIVVNNGDYGIKREGSGTIISTYNDVWNNASGQYSGVPPGTGDISNDPLFVNSANSDFHLKSTGGHWTPDGYVIDSVKSPCIDAGDFASDYSKEPTPNGGRINMGAYGNTLQASKSWYEDCSKPKSLFIHNAKTCI